MKAPRKIIHVDMDAFYASVEMRDDPSLRSRPIAVGGSADSRGVIATANYMARKFGVRSAIPSWKAMKLCPDLRIIPCHFDRYKEESRAIHEIFHRFTDIIEPLSLDEAFLDVTSAPHHNGSATLIAEEIRHLIAVERNLTASAGVAPNKFLAKVASDWNKPNGLLVITPNEIDAFVKDLPIERIFGVGKVTAEKLHRLGIATCGDMQLISLSDLDRHFGIRGARLYQLARGIDDRAVQPHRIRKSVSVEDTFPYDLTTLAECLDKIPLLHCRLMARHDKIRHRYYATKLFVKVKFNDFACTTVESSLYFNPTVDNFAALIETGWNRKKRPVRLLGLGLGLSNDKEQQLTFW